MASTEPNKDPFFYTKSPFWNNKKWYPLWLLQVLTIFPLTGFFGIDHLFLRSPITALTKSICNIFSLGLWYFYDIIQVTLDRDTVKQSGFSIPIYGASGIGAGMFMESPDDGKDGKAPWRFMLYVLLTILPFGFDFLVAGDFVGAALRFMTTVLFFLWPLGFIWGSYNMYRAWITPGDLLEKGVYRIWPYSMFVGKYFDVGGTLGAGITSNTPVCREKGIIESVMEPVNTVVKVVADTIIEPVRTFTSGVAEIPSTIMAPIKMAVEEGLAPSITAGLKVGQIVPKVIKEVPQLAQTIGSKLNSMADPAAFLAKASQSSVLPKQPLANPLAKVLTGGLVGGGISNYEILSDSALLFTVGLLIVGGGILTLLRSSQEIKHTDSPPNPKKDI